MKRQLIEILGFIPDSLRRRIVISGQGMLSLWKYGDPHFFRSVALEISTFCNRTCSYCPNAHNVTPKEFMSEEMFETALMRMVELNWCGPVDFNFYNEPLLDKRLPELMGRVSKRVRGAMPRVITNGDALTVALVRRLVDAGLVRLSISRHQPIPAGWDARIAEIQHQWPGLAIINEMQGRTDLSTRSGLVQIENYIPITECDAPAVSFQITINGDVVLCCNDYHRKHVFGNIARESILEIWRNPKFKQIRDEVRDGVDKLPICKACFGHQD
jgi:cyclic pyranopterin phosphate synthase